MPAVWARRLVLIVTLILTTGAALFAEWHQ
jgi:hypothetical protein